jgi:hypothetical protein
MQRLLVSIVRLVKRPGLRDSSLCERDLALLS